MWGAPCECSLVLLRLGTEHREEEGGRWRQQIVSYSMLISQAGAWMAPEGKMEIVNCSTQVHSNHVFQTTLATARRSDEKSEHESEDGRIAVPGELGDRTLNVQDSRSGCAEGWGAQELRYNSRTDKTMVGCAGGGQVHIKNVWSEQMGKSRNWGETRGCFPLSRRAHTQK